MVSKNISSVQNPLVKHFCKLRIDKKYRKENQAVLLVGRKEIKEVSKKIIPLYVLVAEGEKELNFPSAITCAEDVLTKIGGLKNPEPCAVFSLPKEENFFTKNRILILDHIQDPGNLGTLVRSALALNFDGIVLINTVDPFNDKALRAAKGATFHMPLAFMSKEEVMDLAKNKSVFIADIKGEDCSECKYKKPYLLILGHETMGPGDWPEVYTKITIPMNAHSESLNVASAGAILMYEMKKNA